MQPGLRTDAPGKRWAGMWSILFPKSEVADNTGDCRELSPWGYQFPVTTCWCHLLFPFPHHEVLRAWNRRASGVCGAQLSAQAVKVTVIERMPSLSAKYSESEMWAKRMRTFSKWLRLYCWKWFSEKKRRIYIKESSGGWTGRSTDHKAQGARRAHVRGLEESSWKA